MATGMSLTLTITIRDAFETDMTFARDTHHRAYRDVVMRQFGFWDGEVQDHFFEKSWNAGGHRIILVNGQPCGYVAIEYRDEDIHIRELVVHPAFQNMGIGTTILEQVLEEAKSRRVPVRLGTFHENRAVKLYQRLGFKVFDQTPTHFLMEYSL
jgi:ribosomal protein S18 acetylase RimI-like enzyme